MWRLKEEPDGEHTLIWHEPQQPETFICCHTVYFILKHGLYFDYTYAQLLDWQIDIYIYDE